MSTISEVREGLASTLQNVPELRTIDYVTEGSTLPAADIRFGGSQRQAMQRGSVEVEFEVTVITSLPVGRIATTEMDRLVSWSGTESAINAIETNRTLGLDDANAHVSAVGGYIQLEGWGVEHVACQLTVTVHTRGDS